MKPKTKYNKDQILRWVRNGNTTQEIAGFLKVTRQRASQIILACGVPPRQKGRPQSMRHESDLPYRISALGR